ncbi:Hypothetical predicted protein, partial [Pelobates cultripes]
FDSSSWINTWDRLHTLRQSFIRDSDRLQSESSFLSLFIVFTGCFYGYIA